MCLKCVTKINWIFLFIHITIACLLCGVDAGIIIICQTPILPITLLQEPNNNIHCLIADEGTQTGKRVSECSVNSSSSSSSSDSSSSSSSSSISSSSSSVVV